MKKLLLTLCFAGSLGMSAQTVIFEDSFESYADFAIANVGAWTLTDVDQLPTYGFQGVTFPNSGVAKSFQVFNAANTVAPLTPSATSDWSARTGVRNMVCFASSPSNTSPEGFIPQNNDYLISPQITLASSGNLLSFWAKACSAPFFDEEFTVWISTTGTAVADFTLPTELTSILTAGMTYEEYTADLDEYAGQQVYIAIQCTSTDQFGFALDDFKVTTTDLGVKDVFSQSFAVYPNPANSVVNVRSTNDAALNTIEITDINGRIVKTTNAKGVLQTEVNIADLASGAYFLKINTTQGTATKKVMKN